MFYKTFSYQVDNLSIANSSSYINIINDILQKFELYITFNEFYDSLEKIKKDIFLTDFQKIIIEDKLMYNIKLKWMFKNMLYRKKLQKAYQKSPWNNKTAVALLPIDDIPDEEKIIIISHGKQFIFHSWELIKTIDISLHNCSQFTISPEPAKPINPFTGVPFTLWELSSIFNQLEKKNIQLPLYLMLFKDSKFDLNKMVFRNQYLISINTIKTYINNAEPYIILREIISEIKNCPYFSIKSDLDESEHWEPIDLFKMKTFCTYCINDWLNTNIDLYEIKNIMIRRLLLSNKLETRDIHKINRHLSSPKLDIIKYIIQDNRYNEIFKKNHYYHKIKIDLSQPPQTINTFLKKQKELHKRIYIKGKKSSSNKLKEDTLKNQKNKKSNDNIDRWCLYIIGLKRIIEINKNKVLKYVKNNCNNILGYNEFINKLNKKNIDYINIYKCNKNIKIHEYWGKINELNNKKNMKYATDRNNIWFLKKSRRYTEHMYEHNIISGFTVRKITDSVYIKSLY
jgi:hypothetical protein